MQSTSRSDIDAMHRTIARESDPWKKMLLIYDYCHDLQSSDPRLCIRLAREGLSIARRFGDHIKIARGYLHLGFAHALLTKQAEAIRAFLAAERHFGKAGERKGQGIALTNLMLLYDRRKGGGKALEIGKQALEIFEALESERHIATVLEAMAQIHIGKGHYGVGLEMGLRALRIWDGIGGGGNALKMRMLVVGIYKDIDENQTALRYAEEALEECRGTGSLEEASLLGTIGILRSEMGELAAGIELLGQGLSLALAGDHPSYGRPRCMALAGNGG